MEYSLCPKMDKKLQEAVKEARSGMVTRSSETEFEVHSTPTVKVNILLRTCTCSIWQNECFPCAHVVAAVQRAGKDLNSFIESYFHVAMYKESYAILIVPIPTLGRPEANPSAVLILPPLTKKQIGRPKKNRIPSRGEKRRLRCGRCRSWGSHNKTMCKAPI
ncbi:hypothetical protein LguiA_013221 [Lonicera macranthoides]